MATSARTPAPLHPPLQSLFTINGAPDALHPRPQPQYHSAFAVPTTAMTRGSTLEKPIKKAYVSPIYSLFPSLIRTKTSSSIASPRSQSLRSTTPNISPTTTNISSIAMEISLPTRRRAREIEIFGKRPFEFSFSRHKISSSEKEKEEKKKSRTISSDTEPEEGSTTPNTSTTSLFLRSAGDRELEKFTFKFDNEEVDLTFPCSKSKPAISAWRTSISSSFYPLTPSLQRQSQEDEDLGLSFGRYPYHTSTRGRNPGAVNSGMPPSPIATQQAQVHDPHPGTPVTFGSGAETLFASSEESSEWNTLTNCLSSGEVRPSLGSIWNARSLAEEEHHRTLGHLAFSSHPSYASSSSPPAFCSSSNSPHPSAPSSQANMSRESISDPNPAPVSSTNSITSTDPISACSCQPREPRMENVDYQARKLERRARSLQKREILLRYGCTLPSTTDAQSTCRRQNDEAAQDAEPTAYRTSPTDSKHNPSSVRSTHSSSSTSSTSVSVFLSSVRASFEARQSQEPCPSLHLSEPKGGAEGADEGMAGASGCRESASYDVFVDEQQRGFLDAWWVI